jgi:hypothetical protein
MRYPVTGPASTIPCPRHGLAVALNEAGYIVSSCPACVRDAERAEAKLAEATAARGELHDELRAEVREAVSPTGAAEASIGV